MTLTPKLQRGLAIGLVSLLPLKALAQTRCTAPQTVVEATPAQVSSYFKAQKKTVLTFMGFSGDGYEDPVAMLDAARRVLSRHKPSNTIVNIGATAVGIGAVYELAVQGGFATTGIVSTLARDNAVVLAPCVQQVFYIKDATWGGLLPDSQDLSPTSKAMLAASHTIVAIGGGEVSRDEFLAARRTGKKTSFVAADKNHESANDKALKKGQPLPTDYRGALAAVL